MKESSDAQVKYCTLLILVSPEASTTHSGTAGFIMVFRQSCQTRMDIHKGMSAPFLSYQLSLKGECGITTHGSCLSVVEPREANIPNISGS